MSQPSAYERATNFSAHQASNPTLPLPAGPLDEEFSRVQAVINEIRANLAVIQRDDTELANRSVGFDQLRVELHAGLNEPNIWATETRYIPRDAVFVELRLYRCLQTHVSGVFETDLASGKWKLIADFTGSGMQPYSATLAALSAALASAPMASQGEAESAAINNKLMTPLRAKQHVDARLASQAEAEAGASTSKLMSPLRAKQLFDKLLPPASSISVAGPSFGATQIASQTPAARRAAMQAAIDYAWSVGVDVFIPVGTWLISGALQYNSGQIIRGAGKYATILKLADDAPSEEAVLRPKGYNADVTGARISDLTVHGNAARQGGLGVGVQRPGGSGVSTNGSKFCSFDRIYAVNCQLHGFDDCSAGTVKSGLRYYHDPDNAGPTKYVTNSARFNVFTDCTAEDPGDDCFTTHYQEYSWFRRCDARNYSQRHTPGANNSNGFEADDGSRFVWFVDCFAETVNRAFVVKGHDAYPPAKQVFVSNCYADGCAIGLFCDNDDTTSTFEGGVTVNGLTVKNPTNLGIAANNALVRGVMISGYKQVNINGLRLYGKSGDTALRQAINIGTGAGIVTISDFYIENWPSYETSDNTNCPINITSTAGAVHLSNGNIVGFGFNAIRKSGSPGGVCTITNVTGEGTSVSGSSFISLSTGANTTSIENCYATGVTNQVTGSVGPLAVELGNRQLLGTIATGGTSVDQAINKLDMPSTSATGTSGEVLRVSGANPVARFYQTGGDIAGASTAETALRLTANGTTSRSLNAAGTLNASGADYAEYHQVKPHLYGAAPKGAILGFAADGLLTDRWADIVGRFVVKSTEPSLVGGDAWSSEEALCAAYGIEPLGDEASAGYEARRAAVEAAGETERARWDRIAKAGYVPVNIAATAEDIGKYLVPSEDDGGVTASLVAEADLTLPQYIRSIGSIIGISPDGRPLVEVKVG